MSYPKQKINDDLHAFMVIRDHLLAQKKQSRNEESGCAYRGEKEEEIYCESDDCYESDDHRHIKFIPDGSACAVGCLIDDSIYYNRLEGLTMEEPKVIRAVMDSHPDWDLTAISVRMLRNFQFIHDNMDPDLWEYVFDAPVFMDVDMIRSEVFYDKELEDIPFLRILMNEGVMNIRPFHRATKNQSYEKGKNNANAV